ncbi:Transcriptional regulatory protein BaeR [Shimia sp. SK013]|uniref:response regulator transcription factor n=1 Tax=Shimia sp. SK013 TaxID=1389006 RepID=UPI0006B56102|nr:response regulator transcription factor [Shimia sp. SK013]KPA21962.1 Transcriptional regulatory protein BaeR [Shimia sp. SK013]
MAQIVLVDSDRSTLVTFSRLLESDGHRVLSFVDGDVALRDISNPLNALLVMSTALPATSGLDLLRRLRLSNTLPVILLSDARSDTEEAFGLHLGADDYIRKPAAPRVLLERIRAVLRRTRQTATGPVLTSRMMRGPLMMDRDSHEVRWNGCAVGLTATEFNVLWTLADRPGTVLERARILDAAYGTDLGVTDRCIDSQIKRLRMKFRKVDPDFDNIETLYALGYRFIQQQVQAVA